jgi:hypothetical protein
MYGTSGRILTVRDREESVDDFLWANNGHLETGESSPESIAGEISA